MAGTDAPQWLRSAYRRSVQAIGGTAEGSEIDAVADALLERWAAPERVHHNLKRLVGVLARVDELAAETHDPDVVRLAAWYHGAVFTSDAQHAYSRRGGADAEGSAELARTELTALGVPESATERVVSLVRGLSRHVAPPDDIDAQALCDADLGGLAAEPQRYASYRREVRAEYAHIPERDYVEARLAIVTRLLERRQLFASPLGQCWEDRARDNLQAERSRLQVELTALPERLDGERSSVEDLVAAKMATFDAFDDAASAAEQEDTAEPQAPMTVADRVGLARREAQERASERRAAAAADRERRRLEKVDRHERRERERAGRGRDAGGDDGSSMSRPPLG